MTVADPSPPRPARPPRTVAWLIGGGEGGGVRRLVVTLALAVARHGWRAAVVSLGGGESADAAEAAGLQVCRLDLGPAPRFAGRMWEKPAELLRARQYRRRALPAVAAALDELAADAVHVVSPHLVELAGRAAAVRGSACFWEMPNVVGDRYPLGLNRRLYQWTCRRHGIQPLANSAYTAATLGDRPVRPIIFHHVTEDWKFDPARVDGVRREALGVPADAPLFGLFARLTPAKGQLHLLRALLRCDFIPTPHLLLLGGAPAGESGYAEQLRRVAGDAGAAERLHLLGAVEDVERYYPPLDVAVNARVDPEPFGLSVIEAMLMGVPVLAHALGGPAETVIDGETGWLMPDVDDATFDAAVARVLADRPRWGEMGSAARSHALAHFTADRQAERYAGLVERRLAGADR